MPISDKSKTYAVQALKLQDIIYTMKMKPPTRGDFNTDAERSEAIGDHESMLSHMKSALAAMRKFESHYAGKGERRFAPDTEDQ